jgi:hypothetical protein
VLDIVVDKPWNKWYAEQYPVFYYLLDVFMEYKKGEE